MRVIGLTGTIGAGKSTVMGWLAELGAYAIDSDQLIRHLYETDRDLQAQLQARFGTAVVAEGRVDRQALSRAVFGNPADPNALADLEALTHPIVLRAKDDEIARARAAGALACVLEAIKLVESGGARRCDEVWIVVAGERVQLQRLAGRGVPEDEARRRLAAQGTVAAWTTAFVAESTYLGRARPIVIFDNSGDEAAGRAQVSRLWHGIAG